MSGQTSYTVDLTDPRRGGTPMPGSCWCMWWRERSGSAATNKQAMSAIVNDGQVPGLIAYEDDVAVGWVSVAPPGRLRTVDAVAVLRAA